MTRQARLDKTNFIQSNAFTAKRRLPYAAFALKSTSFHKIHPNHPTTLTVYLIIVKLPSVVDSPACLRLRKWNVTFGCISLLCHKTSRQIYQAHSKKLSSLGIPKRLVLRSCSTDAEIQIRLSVAWTTQSSPYPRRASCSTIYDTHGLDIFR